MPIKDPEKYKRYHAIHRWKNKCGLICREGETYDDIFDRVQNTANCELCNVLLTSGRSKTGRAMDHDHSTGYFRKVLCMGCNSHYKRDENYFRKDNTSGHKNIFIQKNGRVRYTKEINKKRYNKTFKTLDQAIEYKLHFEKKIKESI